MSSELPSRGVAAAEESTTGVALPPVDFLTMRTVEGLHGSNGNCQSLSSEDMAIEPRSEVDMHVHRLTWKSQPDWEDVGQEGRKKGDEPA